MTADEIVRTLTEAVNRHDLTSFISSYAPEAVVHDPQYPDPLRGRDAIGKDLSEFISAFPDLTVRVTRVVSQGDTYAFEGVMNGTHGGPLLGPAGHIPATNRQVELGIGVFGRLDSRGNIEEERRYYDVAGMLAQLGLMQ